MTEIKKYPNGSRHRIRECGCDYLIIDQGERCIYLCVKHQYQFILRLYNEHLEGIKDKK